jgi:hypothetical protein
MEKIKQVVEATQAGVNHNCIEAAEPKASELRALEDLELMLAGGGESIVIW